MTLTPLTEQQLAELTAIAARAANEPFFVSDCEGSLQVWREKALTHVRRDEHGVIDMYSFPSTYKVTDQVIELDLSTWDPGEDATDDQQRQDIRDLVEARAALGALLAEIDRQRTELAELTAENAKLIRWHGEDGKAFDRMRDTIVRLRTELATGQAAPTPAPAPPTASHHPAGDRDGETGTEGAAGREEPSRRTLTPNEYDAAWHAVEGAAGEEGADPGTVLHAVLDRLGIEWQDAARTPGSASRR